MQTRAREVKGLGGEAWGLTIMAHANEGYQRELMVKKIERGWKYASKQEEMWRVGNCNGKDKEGRQQKEVLRELMGDNPQDSDLTGDEPTMERLSGGESFETLKQYKQR
jgi:hypothetical protein